MFNLSTQEVVSSIEKAPLVNLDGLLYQEYDNFFGKTYELSIPEDEDFEQLVNQEDVPRVVLSKKSKVSRQLAIFFMQSKITDVLNKKFGVDLKFASVDVWIDGKGYSQPPHLDDKRVKLHVHVYLTENSVGTSLYSTNITGSEARCLNETDPRKKIHTFKFSANKGYALLNNDKSWHGVDEVKEDGRISLYARYS